MFDPKSENNTMPELMTETLPEVRVTPSMKRSLQGVANSGGISNRLSDHIRLAVKMYLEMHDRINSDGGTLYKN